jgi:hypothetical protein
MYPRVLATVPTARSVIRMMMRMMRMMVRMVTVLQRIQRTSALADLEQYGGHNDGFQDLENDAEEKIPSQRKQRIRERMKEEEPERERDRDTCRDRYHRNERCYIDTWERIEAVSVKLWNAVVH